MSQAQYSMINRGLKEQVKRNPCIGRHRSAPPNYHTWPWYAQVPMASIQVFHLQPCLLGNGFRHLLWSDTSSGVARSSGTGVTQTLIKATALPRSTLTSNLWPQFAHIQNGASPHLALVRGEWDNSCSSLSAVSGIEKGSPAVQPPKMVGMTAPPCMGLERTSFGRRWTNLGSSYQSYSVLR